MSEILEVVIQLGRGIIDAFKRGDSVDDILARPISSFVSRDALDDARSANTRADDFVSKG